MIPESIPFSAVILGERGRQTYTGIDELAESIDHVGLIQPIVLAPTETDKYLLVAGGRRYHALKALGVTTLFHGSTTDPAKPGFVLRGEPGTELTNLLAELAENLDREGVDWRDECKMLVRAARLVRKDAYEKGTKIIQRDLGAILGCGYNDINAAERIYDDLVANPQDYVGAASIRNALQVLLKKTQRELERELVRQTVSVQVAPKLPSVIPTAEEVEAQLSVAPAVTVVPLSQRFFNMSGLDWLRDNRDSVDHIITDPDFGIEVERLEAGAVGAGEGVYQKSLLDSLADMDRLFRDGFYAVKQHGFLVYFFDNEHNEKLIRSASAAGWAVQRWPLIWHKTDYRSNASPQSNFTKNIEYAMVCRKPGSTLAVSPQPTSIFPCDSGGTTKDFGHPFAKPRRLWHWIYQAVAIKGQTVFDPFAGSGSACASALDFGLAPMGCEVQERHYNTLCLNMQREYQRLLGGEVRFE